MTLTGQRRGSNLDSNGARSRLRPVGGYVRPAIPSYSQLFKDDFRFWLVIADGENNGGAEDESAAAPGPGA
jgi:hypothetical protein